MSVTLNKFEYLPASLYDGTTLIGRIETVEQLNDVRIQIKEQALKGYYMIWTNKDGKTFQILINKFGTLDHWWPGFFDITDYQLQRLLT